MTWNAIETAPLDEFVLVWLPAEDEDGIACCVWTAILVPGDEDLEEEEWWSFPSINNENSPMCYSSGELKPLFWTPLPEAP